MTLNGVMAFIFFLFFFSPNSLAFGASYVQVVEDKPIVLSATKCGPKNLVFSDISFMAIFAKVTEKECVTERLLRDIDAFAIPVSF